MPTQTHLKTLYCSPLGKFSNQPLEKSPLVATRLRQYLKMECNKDEAVRAKGIAESMLKERDFKGAKKFASKAQVLFPELEGLSKFLDVVNIYIAHKHTTYGEVDHYGVLGVDPSADEDTIRKKYRRMILSVHPDKNRIDGAAGAFMILKDAWEVLSDKDKRSVYDTELNLRALNQASSFSFTSHTTYPPPPPVFTRPSTSGSAPSQPFPFFHHPGNMPYGTFFQYYQWTLPAETATSSQYTPQQGPFFPTPGTPCAGNQQNSATSPPPIPEQRRTPATASAAESVPASKPTFRVRSRNQSRSSTSSSSLQTFWTGCDSCRIKYEFQKKILGKTLQCPRCRQPFLAVEMPAPPSKRKQEDPVVASGGPTNMPPSVARAPQAARGQPSTDHAERGPENLGTASAESAPCTVSGGLHKEKPGKRRRKDGQTCLKRASEAGQQTRSAAELSEHQIRVILMGRAKLNTLNQLNKWKKVDGRDSLDA